MNRCRARYTIGAHIFFLVCLRDEGHDGNHWDEAVEVAWSDRNPTVEGSPS